jgi:hypothetical protein
MLFFRLFKGIFQLAIIMISSVLNSIWFTYVVTILICLFFSGFIIRQYGETCGINIYRPDTWMTTMALMGSPYCRILNQVGQISGNIMENLWIHVIATAMSRVALWIPFTNKRE